MMITQRNQIEALSMIKSLENFFMNVISEKDKGVNRDALFLFDLLYVMEEFSKIGNASQGNKFPHVAYVEEKLLRAKNVLDNCYSYFFKRKEEEKNKEKGGK